MLVEAQSPLNLAGMMASDKRVALIDCDMPQVTSDLLATIEEAKEHKPDINVFILWNKFRPSTKSAKDLSQKVKDQLNLKEMATKIGYRVAYSDSFGEALTVTEWTYKAAKDEMLMLGVEINYLLKMKSTRKN